MALPSKQQDLVRLARQAGIYMAIPMILAGGPTLGFLIGRYLDRRFSTDPWGVTAAVVLGLLGGIAEAIRLIRYAQRTS